MNLEEHKAHATALSVMLPLSIVSICVYIKNINVDLKTLIVISVAGFIGGFLGAKYLKKVPSKYLHKIFGIFMLIGAWRMIL